MMRGQTRGTTANRHLASLEHDEQSALMAWAAHAAVRYPELEWLFAIPNGGKRAPATARRLKKEGVKAGVPDTCLPVARGPHHGLFIEMKTKRGTASPAQKSWLDFLLGQGYLAVICRGWCEAANVLCDYLGIDDPDFRPATSEE